jgi:HAE1 family hydrophobic/amphiphilic exporter-1
MAEIFIRRPIMTTLVMFAIFIFGLAAYRLLPVSDLPNVDFPTIQVSANLSGANPDTMASAVATPLERQFSTIAGVDSMTSVSGIGATSITIQFTLSRNIDAAAQDVQAAISRASRQLPRDMPTPPSFRKVNPADQPVIYLALSSPTLPLYTVNEYADIFIAQRISMISGVAQVQVFGSQKYAVRAQLDPKALASRRIGIDEVADALARGNINLPTSTLYGEHQAFTIQATGQLYSASAYRPLVVAYRNGAPVRLQDLGRVIDNVENDKVANWFNNSRAVVLAIQRQPGTNTIEVVDSIKSLLPVFRAQMPASVNLDVLYDRSVSIRELVSDVKFTLILTGCLVVLVIFLFLRNISATIIPSLALPFSIIGTFAAMYAMVFSIDNISLMALTLSVGFVVDDAIVMLENIVRHMEKGEGVMEAALKGSREIGFTILSMTLSLVAVFIPVLFMGGIMGRILHEFAVTISMAILISGFVSLTLTPMLCSRFLRPPGVEKHGRLYLFMERFFDGMLRAYDRTLQTVLHYRRTVMGVIIILTAATAWLFREMPKGFLPSEDTGQIFAFTEAAQGISFDEMVLHQKRLADIVARDPNIDAFMSAVGAGGASSAGNTGRIMMRLKPRKERDLSADEIIQELKPKLAQVTGIRMFMQNLPAIRIGGQLTKSPYQYTLQSPDKDILYRFAVELEMKMRGLPRLQDVTSDLQIRNPQVNVEIDRDRAAVLGLSAEQVEDALFYAYGFRQVSTIYAPNNQYQVILELDDRYQMEPSSLSMLYIRSSGGQLVPLDTVATLSKSLGPLTVNHLGQLPAVTISFNTKPGVALGDARPLVEKEARDTLPPTISTSFQGTAQAFQASFKGLWLLLLMAVLVIYIVLGILYESFVHPLTILSGLPAAGFGALVTLMLFHKELNIYAFVGVIIVARPVPWTQDKN